MSGLDLGAAPLDDLRDFIARFVAFPSAAALHAAALWVAHAHLALHFFLAPRLALLSPEPGSGKTRALEVIETVVPGPMFSFSASPAAIFRTLAHERRTLLFDEVDTVFTRKGKDDNEDMRALLNMGYRRGATIPRCIGPLHEVRHFPVFAPVALAGLGDLPDTIMSRSIIIRMRRRAPSERIEQFRSRLHGPDGALLRERLAAWAEEIGPEVGEAWPAMPGGVVDREAEVWEPLLAVADVAGGHWPDTARAACVELLKVASDREVSLGVRLLGDLRTVFGDRDSMSTVEILEALNALDEAPWGDLYGKPMQARTLARMLAKYEVKGTMIKAGGRALRGYRREALWDAWARYIPPVSAEVQPMQPGEPESADLIPHGTAAVVHPFAGDSTMAQPMQPSIGAEVAEIAATDAHPQPLMNVLESESAQVVEVADARVTVGDLDTNDSLASRAVELAAELRSAGIGALRQRYGDARPHATSAPDWWSDTAKAEPLAVTVALELLAEDEVVGQGVYAAAMYLTAARAAVAGAQL